MAEGQIVVELILDDGQVLKALGKVRQEADKTKDSLENDSGGGFFSKSIGSVSVGMLALGAAAVKTFDVLKDGFTAAVGAARESQKAIDDLSTALAVNGKFTDGAVASFQKFAGALSQQTGVNDDIITQNASLLVSLGNLSGEGLENATKAALDLASATGKDVGSAFQLVAKAAEGNTQALKRYGIDVDDNLPKTEKFASALSQLNEKFGGLAAARADTFEGNLNRLANSFDDLFKAFGNIIVQSPVVRSLIKLVSDVIGGFAERVSEATKGKDLFGDIIKGAIPVARAINTYLVAPLEIFGRAVVTGVSTVATVFLGLSSIFIKVGDYFREYVVAPIAGFFSQVLVGLVSFVSDDMATKLQASFDAIGNYTKGLATTTGQAVGSLYETSLGATIDAANATFETSGTAAIDSLLSKAQVAADTAKATSDGLKQISNQNQQEIVDNAITVGGAFNETLAGMDGAAMKFAENATENFRKIGASMFQAVGNAAGQAFASFGKALASGENALQAFLNSLLASFGQMAIQLGTQFILQGIAYSWAGLPNGPSLIAAGAALATFGGVLSALGGGGGAGAGATAGGAGGGTVSSIENPTANLQQPEPPRPQDKITVNIQGDVLDSDETGGRIIRLLSDYADKNGNGAVVT